MGYILGSFGLFICLIYIYIYIYLFISHRIAEDDAVCFLTGKSFRYEFDPMKRRVCSFSERLVAGVIR